ncbi:MNX1 family protein [Megaselia abdita]
MSSAQVSSQHISRFLNHHGSSPDYHSDNNTSSSPQQSPQSLHSPQSNYTMSPPPNLHHPPHSARYDNYQSVYMSRIPPLHQQQQQQQPPPIGHAIIPLPQFTQNSPPAPKKSFCIDALLAKSQENQENQAKNDGVGSIPLVSEEEAMNRLRDDGREYNSPSPDDLSRSESPTSSHRSSPPISPGCEDQNIMRMDFQDDFKRPHAPHSPHGIRPQDFPIYAGGPPYLLPPGNSAFHRPLDPSGKPIPVSIKLNFPTAKTN